MSDLRMVAKGVVWFEDPEPIHRLMRSQCSAMRSAYQAIHKHGLKGNDVKVHIKQNYMDDLNQRYISDAVSRAKSIRQKGAIFGGKKAWDDLRSGRLSKDDWVALRNDQLYSRGDLSKSGNPNLRIVGQELWVNDPSGRGSWIRGQLFVPEKFEVNLDCYDVRLTSRSDGRFDVLVTWEAEIPQIEVVPGAIGIDINPSGCAVVEVDGEGNLMSHTFLSQQRMQFASKAKRRSDVELMAVEIVRRAEESHKSVVVEDLKFRDKKGSKKFNRMRHNFLFAKITEAVERRAIGRGIPVVRINPAFTSDLGVLKYQRMYSMNDHCSAALVIARRGLGITEKQTFDVFRESKPKGKGFRLNLEGRGRSLELSPKAWGWLRNKFLRPRNPSSQDRDPSLLGVLHPRDAGGSSGKRPKSRCEPRGEPVTNNWSVTSVAFATADS